MDKKYNEFKVTFKIEKGEVVILKKELTERGHVMISERDAEINNLQTRYNGLHYELSEEQPEQPEVKKTGRKKTVKE